MRSASVWIVRVVALVLFVATAGSSARNTAEESQTAQAESARDERRINGLDADKNGRATIEERESRRKRSTWIDRTRKVSGELDKDGDGRRSSQEFKTSTPLEAGFSSSATETDDGESSGGLKDLLRRIPIIPFTEDVKVTLTTGKFTLDRRTVAPCNRVVFHVKNASEEQHHFVVAVTDCPPEKMPLENGRVRYFTYSDEPYRLVFRDGGGWSEQRSRGSGLDWGAHRREPGVKIAPGKAVKFRETFMYDPRFKSGTSFILFCNETGHYERGEYAKITVK